MRIAHACCLACALAPLGAASIWLEGEAATERDVRPQAQWYDQVNAEALSGGAWLSHFTHEQEGWAAFTFEVAEAGDYALWLRANYHSARLSWRLDEGEWQRADFVDQQLRGKTLVSGDRRLDIRFLAWAGVGTVALTPGTHRLELRFHSDNQNHGAVDCLVFTTAEWKPFGTDRPPAAAEVEGGK